MAKIKQWRNFTHKTLSILLADRWSYPFVNNKIKKKPLLISPPLLVAQNVSNSKSPCLLNLYTKSIKL